MATSENRAEFVIALDGDDSGIRAIFNAFKTSVKSGAAELQKATSDIQLFKGLKAGLDEAETAVFATTSALLKLKAEVKAIKDAGGDVGKDLAQGLKEAQAAASTANKEFASQERQLARVQANLKAAGVDLKALGTEEIRLATAAKQAAAAEQDRAAAAVLGIKLSKDTAASIQQQIAAFQTLKANGTATVLDLANAEKALNANVKEATASLQKGGTLAADFGATLKTSLTGAVLPLLGITAAIGTITTAFTAAVDAAHQFHQALAEIGTVTKLTKEELDTLGEGVREVALATSTDLNAALQATKDLLRSGVPKDNVLEVLKVSAEAARAGLTDVGTGAKAANLLLDSFGANVADLPALFDKITVGAHNGGATLKEFADNAGPLLNVAQATGQSFDSLLAVLTVLVDKGGDASKSFSDLTKILANIGTSQARENLAALGITSTDIVQIFQQLGEKGKTLNDVIGLGLSSGGAKSASALAALSNNAGELPEKFDAITNSAGEVKRSLDQLFDTPEGRTRRFDAEVNQLKVSLGNLVGPGSRAAAIATAVVHEFNQIPAAIDAASREANRAGSSFDTIANALLQLDPAAANAKAALAGTAAVADAAASSAKAAVVKINEVKEALKTIGGDLASDVKARQDALARDLADIQSRAEAQIAALSRIKAAESATANETLAIQLKAAADKLALIQASEKAITDAVNAANAARLKGARDAGVNDAKVAADNKAASLAAIGQTLSAYQKLYADLIAMAQTAALRVQGFDEARISVAQKVEDEIRGIRFAALSGLDQYVARMAEVDRLVSEARKKAAEGDTAAAKQFFDNAIEAAKGLGSVVKENGDVLISKTQAQTDKISKLKAIQDASNEAFGEQAAAAKAGADGAIAAADAIRPHIADLQAQYDALKRSIAEGLEIKVATDEASFSDAFRKLEDLTRPRTVTITVETVNAQGQPQDFTPQQSGASNNFGRGGYIRGFARGGAVFRTPAWARVPGSGSGDTVPARLQAGSYVVRQSASRYYGDGLMGRLARGAAVRGFAGGGPVDKLDVQRWAEKLFGGLDPFGIGSGTNAPTTGPGTGKLSPDAPPKFSPLIDPKLGFRSGDSFQSSDPPISFDSRPIPEALLTALNVIQYAKEMLQAVGQTNPILGNLLPDILGGISKVENDPTNADAIQALLQAAETIGLNPYIFDAWGLTSSHVSARKPEGFVDWLELRGLLAGGAATGGSGIDVGLQNFAQRFFESAMPGAGLPPTIKKKELLLAERFLQAFASGGESSDTVRAMLTPGEYVIRKSAASRYGPGLLNAINTMAIPRGVLANLMAPPMPVSRFAEGGAVGAVSGPAQPATRGAIGSLTLNMNADAGAILSEANFRRFTLPLMRDVLQRSGVKI